MKLVRNVRLKIWLSTLLGLMLLSWIALSWIALSWATMAYSDEGDISYFQLAVGEGDQLCLRQFMESATEQILRAGSCADPETSLWQRGENKTLVLIAGGDPTELCLTRSEERDPYVTICYEGSNNEQSWAFNEHGEVFLFSDEKRGDSLTVNSALQDGEPPTQLVVRGSFQWLKNDPARKQWCYVRPWNVVCPRVCVVPTEDEQCVGKNTNTGAAINNKSSADSGAAKKNLCGI